MDEESRMPNAECQNDSGEVNPRHSSYPIRQSEEHAVARRQFATFCGAAAVALTAGVPLRRKLLAPPESGTPIEVAAQDELAPGEALQFGYPTADHPCLLIRLSETGFAAFSARCTHLMCPVDYDGESNRLVCPCHHGLFNAEDGRPVAGPPRRPLPRYEVTVTDGRILVGPGLIPPTEPAIS